MATGRRFSLPIDPWPRPSLAERTAAGSVLILLLAVPCLAAAILLVLALIVVHHVCRSYDLGTALRALIERYAAGGRRFALLLPGRR